MGLGWRVIKVGGSLLDLAELVPRLCGWLADQTPAHELILAGGGTLADGVRQLDRLHRLGERDAHWLCIEAMAINARALHKLLPRAMWLNDWQQLNFGGGESPCRCVADAGALMRAADGVPELPESWSVTSDSIAAWLAMRCQATELVLLKSCPAPPVSLAELASQGYVDRFFPTAAAGLAAVRLVDFRSTPITELRASGLEIS